MKHQDSNSKVPTEGARELAEKLPEHAGEATAQICRLARFSPNGQHAQTILAIVESVAASEVARESAEHEHEILSVIDERDRLEEDVERIARELGCRQDTTNLHSHSECALFAAGSVSARIEAEVARERERAVQFLRAGILAMTGRARIKWADGVRDYLIELEREGKS